jgi:hypothetical protein
MLAQFYIFKKQTRGSARWLEVVSDLGAAKLRVQELAESEPGAYFIFTLEAGRRIFSLEAGRKLDLDELKRDVVADRNRRQ